MFCFFHNIVSTFTNVVHINVENDNVVSTSSNVDINVEIHNTDSTLFDVENSNVEIHNVVSTLIWCCPTSRRRINQKTTLKQRWNVTPKVTWHFNIIITWQKRYLFTFTRNMDPTLSSVVTKDYKSKKLYLLEGYWFFYGYYDRGLCRFG